METMNRHKWHAVIEAWLHGDAIEWRIVNGDYIGGWETYPRQTQVVIPHFDHPNFEWRVKPIGKVIQYRVGLFKIEDGAGNEKYIASVVHAGKTSDDIPGFIKWLTPWVTEFV